MIILRRLKIVLITLELAAQKGIANVSMNMIAAKIVAEETKKFYNYNDLRRKKMKGYKIFGWTTKEPDWGY